MTDCAAPNLPARNVAAVRLLALPMLGALLLSAPAKAEEPAPPPPVETVAGACQHPDESVLRWLRLIGYGGIASNGCQAAVLDWSSRITFYQDKDVGKAAIAFIGRVAKDGEFEVTALESRFLPEAPASGRCRLITPEDAGPRRVLCFAKDSKEGGLANLVEMVIAEKDWPGAATIPGRCSAPGIARYVLSALIVQQTGAQQEPVLVPHGLPACRSLTVVPGQSFAFATAGTEDGVTFLVSVDQERQELLRVKTIILPGGARHAALAGACFPKREADGHVAVLCMAAYADGGATKFVEVGFIPEASRFEWPRETPEPEPAE